MLIRLLRTYLRPYRKAITAVVVLQLVQTLATLYLPTLNADIIDNGVITGDTGYILRTGGMMLAVSLRADRLRDRRGVLRGADGHGARPRRAHGVFSRVAGFSAREVGHFGAPSLITRTTNDVQQVQMLALMTFTLMVAAPIMCVGGIIMALHQDVPLSSLLLVVVPVLGIIVGLIIRGCGRCSGRCRCASTTSTGCCASRSPVSGWSGRSSASRRSASASARPMLSCSTSRCGAGRLMALMFPSVMLVLNVSSVAVLWFGGHLIDSGDMQIGALTAFLTYLLQILMSVMMATFMFVMVPRAEVCAERINEVLDTDV